MSRVTRFAVLLLILCVCAPALAQRRRPRPSRPPHLGVTTDSHETSGAPELLEARKLWEEKSYKLAREKYDELAAQQTSGTAVQREARYMAARCCLFLGNEEVQAAKSRFDDILKEN